MFNKVVSDVFPDLFSHPITFLIVAAVIILAALAFVFLGGMPFVRSATFGLEKRGYRKMLEDEKTRAFLEKVAASEEGVAKAMARRILDKSSKINWRKITQDRDLIPIREMCEDIDILRHQTKI